MLVIYISLFIFIHCGVDADEWGTKIDGCITGHTKEATGLFASASWKECKEQCEAKTSYSCRAISYNPTLSKCWFHEVSKFTVPSNNYHVGCPFPDIHHKYSERTNALPGWSAVVGGCAHGKAAGTFVTKSGKSWEQCKSACLEETSLNCRSIEYRPGTCILSRHHSKSPLYQSPCPSPLLEMTDRIDRHGYTYVLAIANKRGTGTGVISSSTTYAYLKCALMCSKHGLCDSFGWDEDTKECDLYWVEAAFLQTTDLPGFEIHNVAKEG